MMHRLCSLSLLWLGCACLLAGCVSPKRVAPLAAAEQGRAGVYFHPAHKPAGGTQKWNPVWWFGNADDPVPPDWYRPNQKGRNTLWQLRNPLHNFTFYVIGVHDRDFIRVGKEPDAVFSKKEKWNFSMIQYGHFRLPFVSYHGTYLRWYALWREKGNFGLKLHRINKKERKD